MTLKENYHIKNLKKRESRKLKGVPAEPHPLDRHSGTGIHSKPRKSGQGCANWGTYKDDLKVYYEEEYEESKFC